MPNHRYLTRRRQAWYVRLRVPSDLVPLLGRSHIVRSLQTREASIARSRRWAAMAEIYTELGHLRANGALSADTGGVHSTGRDAPQDQGTASEPRSPGELTARRTEHKAGLAARLGVPRNHCGTRSGSSRPTSDGTTVASILERWLGEVGSSLSQQTVHQHRRAVTEFREAQGEATEVASVSRRMAGDYVSGVLMTSGRQPKTVNRIISSLSSLWRWLIRRGIAEANPWIGQGTFAGRNKRAARTKRPYRSEELLTLLGSDPQEVVGPGYGPALHDLLRLGLLTGARLNELCELRDEDVFLQDRAILVREGKTESARRLIPVHSLVWPILLRRRHDAVGGQLFPELPPGGPDKKRSWTTSKRFTDWRRKVLGHDTAVDFHSLRRTFATYLERSSTRTVAVNPSVIAELMGHVKPTLALSLYSGGLADCHLRAAVDSLDMVLEPEVAAALGVPQWDTQGTVPSIGT